jgi:hypothetical protein
MTDNTQQASYEAAQQMLETFVSVGAESFDLTITTCAGEKVEFRRSVPLDSLLRRLRGLLPGAERQQKNVIVRPVSSRTILVQLDDLKSAAALGRVMPVAFLTFHTSPGNHQAWVAISDAPDEDFARRLKKGAGADPTASGATRIAGSVNFKEKYAPNFPRIGLALHTPARIVTAQELTDAGLVAPPEERPARVSPILPRAGKPRKWPDYQRCLDGAPPNHGDTGPDISRADFTWCRVALGWGFPVEEVAARLLEQSSKAREPGQGERYAQITVENAAASIKRETSAKPQIRPA